MNEGRFGVKRCLGAGAALAAGALGAAALAPAAQAEEPASPLASGLLDMPQPPAPGVRRYETPGGALRFVLDRRGSIALLRFEGDEEVHVLHVHPGPRGDEIYKTDTGEVLLRVTALGGITVFRAAAPLGAPVAPVGVARPLAPPPPADVAAALRALERAAARRLGRPVTFVAPAQAGAEAGLVAEAAARAAEGVMAAPGARIGQVVIEFGPAPSASLSSGGALRVVVDPDRGYAGRPSSEAVRRAAVQGPPQD